MAQNLGSAFGKILRIDPLGKNSANGQYGIPASNPVRDDNDPTTLGEIYAYGVRNPQRFAWDPKTGRMFVADIGQNIVEEISPVTPARTSAGTCGRASFRFVDRPAASTNQRRARSEASPIRSSNSISAIRCSSASP